MNKVVLAKKGIPIVMIIVTTLFQASASALIKYGMNLMKTDPANKIFILVFVAAMTCYGIAFPIYTWCLSKLNLSIAQPVVSGSMFLFTILISILFFKESFALVKAAGFAAIIGGIIVVVL
jgi:multidrug transporter EmrE-like cation transporter